MTQAIGGYFGLELPERGAELHAHALRVQSGRAALQAALRTLHVRRLWIPWYVCQVVPEAARAAGATVACYLLDSLDGVPDIEPAAGEAVLVVDYFGLCGQASNALAARVPAGRIIVDASQAFYHQPRSDQIATFYSPRKFFGVPDGGYLVPLATDQIPLSTDVGSASRMAHLVKRLSGDVRGGYGDFQVAEASLEAPGIRGMSALTLDLLRRIDYAAAARRRRANFAFLHERFHARNELTPLAEAASDAVPMCYPLLLDRPVEAVRSRLAAADIFVPHYWPELRAALPRTANAERRWLDGLLALPCDQRYTPATLDRMAEAVDAALTGGPLPRGRTADPAKATR